MNTPRRWRTKSTRAHIATISPLNVGTSQSVTFTANGHPQFVSPVRHQANQPPAPKRAWVASPDVLSPSSSCPPELQTVLETLIEDTSGAGQEQPTKRTVKVLLTTFCVVSLLTSPPSREYLRLLKAGNHTSPASLKTSSWLKLPPTNVFNVLAAEPPLPRAAVTACRVAFNAPTVSFSLTAYFPSIGLRCPTVAFWRNETCPNLGSFFTLGTRGCRALLSARSIGRSCTCSPTPMVCTMYAYRSAVVCTGMASYLNYFARVYSLRHSPVLKARLHLTCCASGISIFLHPRRARTIFTKRCTD